MQEYPPRSLRVNLVNGASIAFLLVHLSKILEIDILKPNSLKNSYAYLEKEVNTVFFYCKNRVALFRGKGFAYFINTVQDCYDIGDIQVFGRPQCYLTICSYMRYTVTCFTNVPLHLFFFFFCLCFVLFFFLCLFVCFFLSFRHSEVIEDI